MRNLRKFMSVQFIRYVLPPRFIRVSTPFYKFIKRAPLPELFRAVLPFYLTPVLPVSRFTKSRIKSFNECSFADSRNSLTIFGSKRCPFSCCTRRDRRFGQDKINYFFTRVISRDDNLLCFLVLFPFFVASPDFTIYTFNEE